MKKFYLLALIFSVFVFLVACDNEKSSKTNISENSKKDDSISVDKNLLDVEVTIPSSLFEGQDLDKVIDEAKQDGIKEVTKNPDGSLTYKMTKDKHRELMDEMESGIKEMIEELKKDESFGAIQDIMYNDGFSEFTMVVDKSSFENSFAGLATLGLGINGMYYQVLDGVKDFKVTVNIKDASTDEVLETIVYPDSLNK
ncbi:hypothetical protein NOW01_06890 [Anoxybacillus salavatliensis]|uniref:hypothetical protein n=1 Tax=Anoxybacillus gonensis TaxID=198467 RepID=UPI00214B1A74|nr:hypothetical protein [Anoxybacillus gonensis]MCQ5364732.1 hypothetical protein [Anoxybacillus gonensis]